MTAQEDAKLEAARRTPFVSYPLTRVLETRKAVQAVLAPYARAVCHDDNFALLLADVCGVVSKQISRDVLADTLMDLRGQRATPQALELAAWRVAGNHARLAAGIPAPAWHRQVEPEWAPAVVTGVQRDKRGRNAGYRLRVRFLGGYPAGLYSTRFFSTRFCRFVAPQFGFSAWPMSPERVPTVLYEFRHPREFVRLRFYAFVTPAESHSGDPGFEQLRFSASVLDWNREIMRKRTRYAAPYVCPRHYPVEHACYKCATGYEHCPAGCHRRDYVTRPCLMCNTQDAVYDVDVSEDACLACHAKRVLRGE